MTVRTTFMILTLLVLCGVCEGREERWNNFAEDVDLKYYLDTKSVLPLPGNVYIVWIKAVAKEKDYFKREYSLKDVSYTLANYEVDCDLSSYRNRGTVFFDKHRKQVGKSLPDGGEPFLEPVQPESVLEMVQNEICVAGAELEEDEPSPDLPVTAILPLMAVPVEPPTLQ